MPPLVESQQDDELNYKKDSLKDYTGDCLKWIGHHQSLETRKPSVSWKSRYLTGLRMPWIGDL